MLAFLNPALIHPMQPAVMLADFPPGFACGMLLILILGNIAVYFLIAGKYKFVAIAIGILLAGFYILHLIAGNLDLP